MITEQDAREARAYAVEQLESMEVVLNDAERAGVEVTDFGLGRLHEVGLQLVVYVNTERHCAKELVLYPWQTCPEHLHPPFEGTQGKERASRAPAGRCLHGRARARPTPGRAVHDPG
jgi:D-lyxose ketol-isomerase